MYLYEHSCLVKRKMYRQAVVSLEPNKIEQCVLCNEIFSEKEVQEGFQGVTLGFVSFDDEGSNQGK